MACEQQVHGARIHVVSGPPAPIEGDGLWTAVAGLHLAVRVADCLPILLWDPGVPAVAAVHAGWRGTAQDIAGAALRVGSEQLGVRPDRVRAALGPSIGACCFEVGDEVVDALRALDLDDDALQLRTGPRARPHVSLRAANRTLLLRAGLRADRVESVGGCTACTPGRYDSWRRDGAAAGRMRGIIALSLLAITLLVAACGPAVSDDARIAEAADAAMRAIEAGGGEGAEALLRPLLAERPDDAWLRAQLARALHRQGRYREAVVQSRLAVGSDPTLWEASWNLAGHHAALGERDAAIAWLQSALSAGQAGPVEASADPDLAPLERDHRYAFFLATGVLSRQEEDAIALLHQPTVAVGEPVTVTVIAIALNRPLMGEREAVEVGHLGRLDPELLRPLARRETFTAGSEAGGEYRQRTFEFTFVPTRPGPVALGPFEVLRDGRSRLTGTLPLEVTDGVAPEGPPRLDLAGFFAAPTFADDVLLAAHEQRGGDVIELDPLGSELVEVPWAVDASGASRAMRFRAASVDHLPPGTPEPEVGAFRSVLVQRATEGWSHVIDVRPGD
jgi:polyphenol oxidase